MLRRAIISGDIQIHLILQEIWSIKGTIDVIVPLRQGSCFSVGLHRSVMGLSWGKWEFPDNTVPVVQEQCPGEIRKHEVLAAIATALKE